jgi:hypothetical protein
MGMYGMKQRPHRPYTSGSVRARGRDSPALLDWWCCADTTSARYSTEWQPCSRAWDSPSTLIKPESSTQRKEGFTFLGFTTQIRKNPRTGKTFPLIIPSKKAVGRIKKEIKGATCRKNLVLPKEVIIARLNQALRGWVNYFYYGNCSKTLAHLRNYVEERVRVYLSRKHRLKGRGYTKYRDYSLATG